MLDQSAKKFVEIQNNALVVPHWLERGVVAACSIRRSDFNFRTQREAAFSENLKVFCESLDIPADRLVYFDQIHGTDIMKVGKSHQAAGLDGRRARLEKADGALTQTRELPLAIFTADCAPLFFYSEEHRAIGLLHVGWRGASLGIVRLMVQTLIREIGGSSSGLEVVIGPAIRSCCYEVGPEFVGRFGPSVESRNGKFRFDLPGFIRSELCAEGVLAPRIFDTGLCTACETELFFSHRREGERAGRMVSIIMILT